MPAAEERRQIFWLSLMENFGRTVYWLCLDASALRGPASLNHSSPPRSAIIGYMSGDSLACLLWDWRGASELSCNGTLERQILTDGAWTEGELTGTYRLLLPPGEEWGARAVVQWITSASEAPARWIVHAQAELPTEKDIRPESATLSWGTTAWKVRLLSTEKSKWNNDIWVTFELGPPGEFRRVPGK